MTDSFTFNVSPEFVFTNICTDRFSFWISPGVSFAKSYTISSSSGLCPSSGPLVDMEAFAIREKIPRCKLEAINNRYSVKVCLSSREYVTPVPAPAPTLFAPNPADPSPAASLLQRLYSDVDNVDVSFIFDPEDSAATNESCVKRAHKAVLYQWPYFKRMFSSEFTEGGAGEKDIRIKDVKPKVFQLLLRFMYTGDISHMYQPLIIFTDALTDPKEASWKDTFLAAHRYELEDLCKLAQKEILDRLTPQTAIPFLFRTGYLFESLREPCIKYVASTSAKKAASKDFRNTYHDHPEFGDLVFEIFEEYHGSK